MKEVTLKPPTPKNLPLEDFSKVVGIHFGKHWQSKTFPASWCNDALKSIRDVGFTPALFGKENGPGQGTVDVDPTGCIDLREKLSLSETTWALQRCPVVICNDSSPLHMAVTGKAWIGFIATAKHPDYIMHWRQGQWAWRMKNLGLGGYWDIMDYRPQQEEKTIDKVDPAILLSWLPKPETIGEFCAEKMNDYFREV